MKTAWTALLLASATTVAAQGNPATHGRDAVPDYDRVFDQDRVKRLDVQVTAADWQRLMDDMASMAGAFGSGGRGSGAAPATEAVTACAGKVEGASCQFGTTTGRCSRVTGAEGLACTVLTGGPGGPPGGAPGGGGGRDDVELLPRTPIYVPATVTFDGEVFTSVGLRLKGNSTLTNSWREGVEKLPFRLNFDEFEATVPAVRDQTFFGFQNVNLTSNALDASFLRAKVGHDLFREAGTPSSATAFVRLHLDRGSGPLYFGLYTLVEIPGRAFLNTHFRGDDGNLYKPNGTGARFTQFVQDSFDKKTNEDEADWSDVRAAITALHSSRSDAAAWRARLEATFNVAGFLRWLAVNTVIGNSDSYGGLAPHNYYLYGDPLDRDRLQWIPWDLDLAFGGMGGGGGGTAVDLFHDRVDASWPLIRFLMDDPSYRASYRTYAEQALSVFDTAPLVARLRREHAFIAPYVVGASGETAGRTFLSSPDEFDRALSSLASYVESRAGAVRTQLASVR